jgi:hypothetical protein
MANDPDQYDGHTGAVKVETDAFVITRDSRMAKVAYGKGVPARRIPLQAVNGVHLDEANMARNGRIRVLLGDAQPGPAVTADNRHPDVIIFTYQQRKAFQKLYNWLAHVAEVNRTNGVDTSAVSYDTGLLPVVGPTQSQTVDSALTGDIAASNATKAGERLQKAHERYSGGGSRPDIAEAAARMGWTMGGKRELKKLYEHLFDDELVEYIAQGTYMTHQGIVVLTTQRVVFVFHGVVQQVVEDFPLDRINSVAMKKGLGSGTLVVHVAGSSAHISGILNRDLKYLVDALRVRVNLKSTPVTGAAPATLAPPDIPDQLKKLADLRDAGILTDEEFGAKKTELLDRM